MAPNNRGHNIGDIKMEIHETKFKGLKAYVEITAEDYIHDFKLLEKEDQKEYDDKKVWDYIVEVKVYDKTALLFGSAEIGGCTFSLHEDFREQAIDVADSYGLFEQAYEEMRKNLKTILRENK